MLNNIIETKAHELQLPARAKHHVRKGDSTSPPPLRRALYEATPFRDERSTLRPLNTVVSPPTLNTSPSPPIIITTQLESSSQHQRFPHHHLQHSTSKLYQQFAPSSFHALQKCSVFNLQTLPAAGRLSCTMPPCTPRARDFYICTSDAALHLRRSVN